MRRLRDLDGRLLAGTLVVLFLAALLVLEGRALAYDPEPLSLRVAEHEDSVVLDLEA